MRQIFPAVISQRRSQTIAGCLTQTTKRCFLDGACIPLESIDILGFGLTGQKFIQNDIGLPQSLPAGSTFSAAFVQEEAQAVLYIVRIDRVSSRTKIAPEPMVIPAWAQATVFERSIQHLRRDKDSGSSADINCFNPSSLFRTAAHNH
jgi:hypothetical protein